MIISDISSEILLQVLSSVHQINFPSIFLNRIMINSINRPDNAQILSVKFKIKI